MEPIQFSLVASLSALVIVASGKNVSSFPGPQRLPEDLKLLGIYKRQATKIGFNAEEKAEMLKLHNDYRRDEGATNMLEMSWDADLEEFAQKHTERCDFIETVVEQRANIGQHEKTGENLYVTTRKLKVKDVVSKWFSEKDNYNLTLKYCAYISCANYTQLVWHESWALGCGVYLCSAVDGIVPNLINAYLVNCQYAPPGNVKWYGLMRPAYRKGPPCSECPSNTTCRDKLCVDTNTKLIMTTTEAPLPPSSRGVVQAHLLVSAMIMALLLFCLTIV